MKLTKPDIILAITMGAITTFMVTLALVSINLGFKSNFLFVWLRSWFIADVIATLSILFIAPHVKRLLDKWRE